MLFKYILDKPIDEHLFVCYNMTGMLIILVIVGEYILYIIYILGIILHIFDINVLTNYSIYDKMEV